MQCAVGRAEPAVGRAHIIAATIAATGAAPPTGARLPDARRAAAAAAAAATAAAAAGDLGDHLTALRAARAAATGLRQQDEAEGTAGPPPPPPHSPLILVFFGPSVTVSIIVARALDATV
jgi:hypothetical protein